MRIVKAVCDRCGSAVLEGLAVVQITAGDLRARHPEPLDFCPGCAERFGEWLRSGKQAEEPDQASAGGARPAAPVRLPTKALAPA